MHIKTFAKINLGLDVGFVMPNGMHPVDMVMQQISLHDDVTVNVREGVAAICNLRDAEVAGAASAEGAGAASAEGVGAASAEGAGTASAEGAGTAIAISNGFSVLIKSNSDAIPTDAGNLAFRAAEKMVEKYAEIFSEKVEMDEKKTICIFIEKRIPVAAGLAGGSGNAAAVIHGLNAIWNLGLSLEELCNIGKTLGSDVPFCIMGQAKGNFILPDEIKYDKLATTCARARGTGTDLTPIYPPLRAHIIVAKPKTGVPTAEVFKGIDSCEIKERPNIDLVEEAIMHHSVQRAAQGMVNVLENYTLKAYPEVRELKSFMQTLDGAACALMSGSGPSVFAIFTDELAAIEAFKQFKDTDYEAFLCKTI